MDPTAPKIITAKWKALAAKVKDLPMERTAISMLSLLWEGLRVLQFERERPLVLIVEDEFLIRVDAIDVITAGGFDVIEAESADEAIAILECRPDITVVFTDVQMPGSMDGLKLAAAIRGRWPPVKIVATSGLFGISEDDLPSGSRFLPKPYSALQIVGALRDMTGQF